ncbi:MAG: NUDIX domain-containing protein [Patescibacteria group bacterium]|nr:NUDIX domain-containing protein [Patescibacteria group bacterium]
MPIDNKHIRPLALALIEHQGKFLACAGTDLVKKRKHYRLIGGGIDFGESASAALRREIREELGLAILKPDLLAVIENIFTFNGLPGHEIIFLYRVKFKSKKAYRREFFPILDSKRGHQAVWVGPESLGGKKIYPPEVLNYI